MAPEMKVEVGSAEIYFAKKLASNDVKVRNRTLKRLKMWLTNKAKSENGLDEIELLKIWKGLFYCMWFSDKPLVQEELAENISQAIHLFSPPSNTGLLFYETFCTTIGREWLGIDRLRMDKFYLLIKKVMEEMFKYLVNSKWNKELVASTTTFLTALFKEEQYPGGLKTHYTENVLPVLFNACKEQNIPDNDIFLALCEPYLSMAAYTNSDAVLRTLRDEYFENLLVEDKDKAPISIPYVQLANRLCEISADKQVATKNRKMLFSFVDKFRSVAEKYQEKPKRKRKRKIHASEERIDVDKSSSENLTSCQEESISDTVETTNVTKVSKKKKKKKVVNVDTENTLATMNSSVGNENSANFTNEETCISQTVVDDTVGDKQKSSKKTKKTKERTRVKKSPTDADSAMVESNTFASESALKPIASESDHDDVKLKLTFSSDESPAVLNKSKNEKKEAAVSGPVAKKKKKKKNINVEDEPQPIKFVRTPPPAAFFKKSISKSEPPKKKLKSKTEKAMLSTPVVAGSKKKVKIDVTKNMAVAHQDLKICPTPPFSPTRKPPRSALKSRPSASDFF